MPADSADPALTGAMWYPCAAPQQQTDIGGNAITGTRDCQIVGDKLPLIIVSHGRGGWFGGHHDTAAALAEAGFVVAAINHPGDTATDKSRVDDLSVFVERPLDIKRLIDFILDAPDMGRIDREAIGLFGFSMGGYTGLVVAGANPELHNGLAGCEGSSFRLCEQLRYNETPARPLTHDPRVKAAVIVDPGPSFFFPVESLRDVKIPIQLWSSDPKLGAKYDSGCCGLGIKDRLPSKPEFHLARNAIHFSFLAPCSPADIKELARICADAPGFDALHSTRIFTPT